MEEGYVWGGGLVRVVYGLSFTLTMASESLVIFLCRMLLQR